MENMLGWSMDFNHVKYGIVLALLSILFGGLLGLSFGCCEDSVKSLLKEKAANVLKENITANKNLQTRLLKNLGFISNELTFTPKQWALLR